MKNSNGILWRLRCWAKWTFFPGTNLHARLRYRRLPIHFGESDRKSKRRVLDAGSGNGMLAYKAWAKGNQVLAVSIKSAEVAGCRNLFNQYLEIDQNELEFRECNLYALDLEAESFDEVICSETLEHLLRDEEVCRTFWRLLKPGGMLHLCTPNAEHPYNKAFLLDYEEKGGHVRPGYTEESYRELLEPLGFEVEETMGLGGPIRQAFNRKIKELQSRLGAVAGLPLFLLALLVLPFERRDVSPTMPFSIYAKVGKPLEQR